VAKGSAPCRRRILAAVNSPRAAAHARARFQQQPPRGLNSV